MELGFEVGGRPALFRRDAGTGRATLTVGDEVTALASPYSPLTHLEFTTRRSWRRQVGDHVVEVTKVRPRAVGGLRTNSFTITVDGTVVAEAEGK